jgi:hypothetical protein
VPGGLAEGGEDVHEDAMSDLLFRCIEIEARSLPIESIRAGLDDRGEGMKQIAGEISSIFGSIDINRIPS